MIQQQASLENTKNPPVFTDEWVTIDGLMVSMESWQSEAERRYYRERAERILDYQRTSEEQLTMAKAELEGFQPLVWEDVFDPRDAVGGVSYDKDRVSTSNLSNEPYRIFAVAESQLERNQREERFLEMDVNTWQQRVDNGRAYLNLLRGQTRSVAELLWFSKDKNTWDDIAHRLKISRPTVQRERDRSIEAVAMYLKRAEFRRMRYWFL